MYLLLHKDGRSYAVDTIEQGNDKAVSLGWKDGEYSIKDKTETLRLFNALGWYLSGDRRC